MSDAADTSVRVNRSTVALVLSALAFAGGAGSFAMNGSAGPVEIRLVNEADAATLTRIEDKLTRLSERISRIEGRLDPKGDAWRLPGLE